MDTTQIDWFSFLIFIILALVASFGAGALWMRRRMQAQVADLRFVDAVLDQVRGGKEVELGEMLTFLAEQGYDRVVADRTLQAMAKATIITITGERHEFTYEGVPVRTSMMIAQATS